MTADIWLASIRRGKLVSGSIDQLSSKLLRLLVQADCKHAEIPRYEQTMLTFGPQRTMLAVVSAATALLEFSVCTADRLLETFASVACSRKLHGPEVLQSGDLFLYQTQASRRKQQTGTRDPPVRV